MATRLLFGSLAVFLLAGAALAQSSETTESQSGLDLSAIDKSANPCQDFYQYACGNWVKNNPIPADESSWTRFSELLQRNQLVLRAVLEDSEQHQDRSPIDQKIGGFYQSCTDEPAIDRLGATPLKPELDRISEIANRQQLLDEVAHLHAIGVSVFFTFDSTPDPNDAGMTIAEVDQGGLGLPERDFYFRTDPRSQEIRQKYVTHMANMFQLIGVPPQEASAKAARILALETSLAKGSLDVTSRRNPKNVVHEMTTAELAKLSPDFDFNGYFAEQKTPEFSRLNVSVPEFFKDLNGVLQSTSMSDLKDYMSWHYLTASAARLSKPFVDENFDFYGRTLSGAKELRPRWKRCVAATDQRLGEALGQKFVEKTFGEQGKERTLQMVHEIEAEMGKDIESITWMGPDTKAQALVKLHGVANKIGYPEKWRDYSSVRIVDGDYFGNWQRATAFEVKRDIDKINKPVDRSEWNMTPPTVNAYYNPLENNINFPAGILQPPFFSVKAGDAVNYGSIGVVIGHELTHGFDDQGRQFDADGNLKDWWQHNDEVQFEKLANCLVNEYNEFSPVPGIHVNGRLTLGENTADNGGIHLAYFALMDDLAKKSIPVTQQVDGYTQTQQFLLGYAQSWCQNIRPEAARLRAQTDPHSPDKFRVNGVVTNLPQFNEAFGCKAGDSMYTAYGCRVW